MQNFSLTLCDLYCSECGTRNTIFRKSSRLKGKEHIKHMYCFVCKKRTAHVEVRV
jgi:ribosomal protein L33